MSIQQPLVVKEYRNLPWHLVDVWHNLDDNKKFSKISIDLDLRNQISESEAGFFIAPLRGTINNTRFYVGLNSTPTIVSDKSDPGRKVVKESCIRFTRFSDASMNTIHVADGGYYIVSKHEGEHVAVLNKCPIKKSLYTFTLTSRIHPSAKNTTIVDLSVKIHADDKIISVGGLNFQGNETTINNELCSFFEVIYPNSNTTEQRPTDSSKVVVPVSQIEIGNITLDNKVHKTINHLLSYPINVPQKATVRLKSNNICISTCNDIYDRKSEFANPSYEKTETGFHTLQLVEKR